MANQTILNPFTGDLELIPSSGGGGSGDVTGPGSSTDNAAARFDGTTGKILQNSPVTIADNGLITITPVGASSYTPLLTFNNNNTTTPMLGWNSDSSGNNRGLQFARDGGIVASLDNSGNINANTFSPAGPGEQKLAINFLTLQQKELVAATPSIGYQTLYFKTDQHLYQVNSDGIETQIDGGANQALSNLTSTSINQSLIPSTAISLNVGSFSKPWANTVQLQSVFTSAADVIEGQITAGSDTTPSAGAVKLLLQAGATSGGNLGIITQNSTASSIIFIETGNSTAGDSGSILLNSGSSSSDSTGNIELKSGTGTTGSGQVRAISGNTVDGNSGTVKLISGNVTGAASTGSTGDAQVWTGEITDAAGTGSTGTAYLRSGAHAGIGSSGQVSVYSGDLSNASSSGFDSGSLLIKSGDHYGTGNSGNLNIKSGDQFGTGDSGTLTLKTGDSTANLSGNTLIYTGSVDTTTSGAIEVASGPTNTGSTGGVQIYSGSGASAGSTSGTVELRSGNADGDTGDTYVYTGDSASSASGNVILQTGTANGTRGYVKFDALVTVMPTGTSDPSTSYPDGSCYYNTSTNNIRILNGGTWRGILLV